MLLGVYPLVAPLVTVYLIMYLAKIIPMYQFAKTFDYSYGLYIYAYPVQKALAEFGGNRYGIVAYTAASFVVTLFFAVLSWHLLEQHALKLKRWQPWKSISQYPARYFQRDKM